MLQEVLSNGLKEEFCNSANETAIGLKESVYDMLTRIADRSSRAGANGLFSFHILLVQ